MRDHPTSLRRSDVRKGPQPLILRTHLARCRIDCHIQGLGRSIGLAGREGGPELRHVTVMTSGASKRTRIRRCRSSDERSQHRSNGLRRSARMRELDLPY